METQELQTCTEILKILVDNISKVIVGKNEVIRSAISSWIAGGHVLLEDVPGTGKTMLARALSKSTSLDFKRVQFTPDLLPTDILGTSIYNQQSSQFDFFKGPLFTTIFLGDEINRATPRTQAALLECMAEGQITLEGVTHILPSNFFVIATQNPVEQHGTFPLPEAQLDRFMMRLSLGYPSAADEILLIKNQNAHHPIHELGAVISEEHVAYLRSQIANVKINDSVFQYASKIVQKTRSSKDIRLGVSPRGMISLIRASQATALFDGLDYVKPTHIFQLVKPVLSHRIVLTPEARLNGKRPDDVIDILLREISVPVQ